MNPIRANQLPIALILAAALAAGCVPGRGERSGQQAGKPGKGRSAGQDPVAVAVSPARLGRVVQPIEVTGTVVPDSEVRILPKVTGRLLWAPEEWSRVEAGQEIARIETPELTWQLQQARAVVGTAQAGLAIARANRQNARDMLRRVSDQYAQGAANPQQLDQARHAEHVAAAQVQQSQAQVAQAEAGVKILEIAAANSRMTSPVSGVITQRLVEVGGMAVPAAPIMVIANARRRLIKAAVPERDLRFLRAGMRADVTSVAYPGRVFAGRLIETGPALDVQTRTVPAKILLAGAGALKFGMSVTVRLLPPAHQGVVVPATAVRPEGDGHAVFLARSGRAQRVPVRVGVRMGGQVEIESGLVAGDPVIGKGADFVKDGDPVAVEKPARAGASR